MVSMFEACFKVKFRKTRTCMFLGLFAVLFFAPFTVVSVVSSEFGGTPEEINKILMSGVRWAHYPVLSLRCDPSVSGRIVPYEVKWIAETKQLWLNVTSDVSGEIVTTVFIDLPAFDEPPEEICQIINGKPTMVRYRIYKCNESIVKKLIIDVLPTNDSYPNSYLESYEYYVANGWDRYYAARGWDKKRYEAYGLDEYYTPVDPNARERDKNNISAAFVWEENYIAYGWDRPGAYVWYRSYYLYSWNPINAGEWKRPARDFSIEDYDFDYAKPFWVVSMNITYSSPATILISQYPTTETEPPSNGSKSSDLTPFLIAVPTASDVILCVAVYIKRIRKRKLPA